MRSLHMKLVMIMVLLILSLMMVVGAFLINSVTAFYLEDFYSQMSDVFSDPGLVSDLTTETPDEENGAERMADVLDAYVGVLGVDADECAPMSGMEFEPVAAAAKRVVA